MIRSSPDSLLSRREAIAAMASAAALSLVPACARDRATPPPGATDEPTADPTAEPTTDPTIESTAEPALGLTEAVDSVISVVEAGQEAGEIRDDVAVDLINLLRQLDTTPAQDVNRRVAELRRKISDRVGEGGLTRTYADELHDRLDRVSVA